MGNVKKKTWEPTTIFGLKRPLSHLIRLSNSKKYVTFVLGSYYLVLVWAWHVSIQVNSEVGIMFALKSYYNVMNSIPNATCVIILSCMYHHLGLLDVHINMHNYHISNLQCVHTI